jgi:hypothetical protein
MSFTLCASFTPVLGSPCDSIVSLLVSTTFMCVSHAIPLTSLQQLSPALSNPAGHSHLHLYYILKSSIAMDKLISFFF